MHCTSCTGGATPLHIEGFHNTATDNRCPKTFPRQPCVYTAQGDLVCESPPQNKHHAAAPKKQHSSKL